jgi:hypothetical protein
LPISSPLEKEKKEKGKSIKCFPPPAPYPFHLW